MEITKHYVVLDRELKEHPVRGYQQASQLANNLAEKTGASMILIKFEPKESE